MALTRFNIDVENIQKLSNRVKGNAQLLKETYDKAGVDIKGYINGTLIPELELQELSPNNYLSKTNNTPYTPVDPYNPSTKKYVQDYVASQMPTPGEVGIASNDYVRAGGYATTGGTSTAYTATLNPSATLVQGLDVTIVPHVACGASPTLSINGSTAVTLKDNSGVALTAGKLKVGIPYTFRYVGSDFFQSSLAGGGGGGGGITINGIVENYKVAAGQTINIGDFVEYVNGVGSSLEVNSNIVPAKTYQFVKSVQLAENTVAVVVGPETAGASQTLNTYIVTYNQAMNTLDVSTPLEITFSEVIQNYIVNIVKVSQTLYSILVASATLVTHIATIEASNEELSLKYTTQLPTLNWTISDTLYITDNTVIVSNTPSAGTAGINLLSITDISATILHSLSVSELSYFCTKLVKLSDTKFLATRNVTSTQITVSIIEISGSSLTILNSNTDNFGITKGTLCAVASVNSTNAVIMYVDSYLSREFIAARTVHINPDTTVAFQSEVDTVAGLGTSIDSARVNITNVNVDGILTLMYPPNDSHNTICFTNIKAEITDTDLINLTTLSSIPLQVASDTGMAVDGSVTKMNNFTMFSGGLETGYVGSMLINHENSMYCNIEMLSQEIVKQSYRLTTGGISSLIRLARNPQNNPKAIQLDASRIAIAWTDCSLDGSLNPVTSDSFIHVAIGTISDTGITLGSQWTMNANNPKGLALSRSLTDGIALSVTINSTLYIITLKAERDNTITYLNAYTEATTTATAIESIDINGLELMDVFHNISTGNLQIQVYFRNALNTFSFHQQALISGVQVDSLKVVKLKGNKYILLSARGTTPTRSLVANTINVASSSLYGGLSVTGDTTLLNEDCTIIDAIAVNDTQILVSIDCAPTYTTKLLLLTYDPISNAVSVTSDNYDVANSTMRLACNTNGKPIGIARHSATELYEASIELADDTILFNSSAITNCTAFKNLYNTALTQVSPDKAILLGVNPLNMLCAQAVNCTYKPQGFGVAKTAGVGGDTIEVYV